MSEPIPRDRCPQGPCSDYVERLQQLEELTTNLSISYRSALESLVTTLEAREPQTYAHSFRVRAYAVHLANLMGYPKPEVPKLAYAALLHDIGKVAVSDAVLLKPGKLQTEELQEMKSHSVVGERIVRHVSFLTGAAKVIRHHHERWDGHGYPDGLSGADIPFESRLFSVADTFDAMTSDRCYRHAMGIPQTRAEITRCAGEQFDPEIAKALLRVSDEEWIRLREQADGDAQAASIPLFTLVEKRSSAQVPDQQHPVTV